VNRSLPYWAAWLLFSLVTIAIAMLYKSAAFVDGQFIPVGNDSFYHARRIIDAAIGSRGFYEFDTMIHVPEGSWINWPWGYDFLLAQSLRGALWIRPNVQPMQFLAYVPVFWVFINIGLLTLIARETRLSAGATAVGLLAFSLLPLTQILHGLGRIDHHFLELTFVLLSLLFGLRFFNGGLRQSAIALGSTLGFALAFHNGLFVLQLPVLMCLFVLWCRSADIPSNGLNALAASIFGVTLLVALPSAALHDGQFEFWTLSWFHVYVSMCSAVVIAYMSFLPFSQRNLYGIVGLGLLLAIPVFSKVVVGSAFLTGQLDVVAEIVEVRSPVASLFQPNGFLWVASQYSLLIFFAPAVASVYLVRLTRSPGPTKTYLSIWVIFGVTLMLLQYRLHPFGSWVLVLGTLLLLEDFLTQRHCSKSVVVLVSLALVAAALQPPLRNQLFKRVPPGLSRDYAATRPIYDVLGAACKDRPGTVLSYGDDGHPIRYHTDCSVIMNNFLITPFHRQKMLENDRLLQMSAQELIEQAPHIRYVFARMYGVFRDGPNGIEPTPVDDIKNGNAPLFVELIFSEELPDQFRSIGELRIEDDRDFAYARVFELERGQ